MDQDKFRENIVTLLTKIAASQENIAKCLHEIAYPKTSALKVTVVDGGKK